MHRGGQIILRESDIPHKAYEKSENNMINPIQAGVFWNHIGCAPLHFSFICLSNHHQTCHDSNMAQISQKQ